MKISRFIALIALLLVLYFKISGYSFTFNFFNILLWIYLGCHVFMELFLLANRWLIRLIVIALFSLILVGRLAIYVIFGGMGTKSRIVNSWDLGEYTVKQTSNIAWVGSNWEKYHLVHYQLFGCFKKTVASSTLSESEPCLIEFTRAQKAFNQCSEELINYYEP